MIFAFFPRILAPLYLEDHPSAGWEIQEPSKWRLYECHHPRHHLCTRIQGSHVITQIGDDLWTKVKQYWMNCSTLSDFSQIFQVSILIFSLIVYEFGNRGLCRPCNSFSVFSVSVPSSNLANIICKSGWWFQTCFIFHVIYGMSSFPTDQVIFFKMVWFNHQPAS